jgi:cytochrome c
VRRTEQDAELGGAAGASARLAPAVLAAAILLIAAAGARATGGDAARGERVFQRCYSCHSVDPHETATLQGPSLYRVLGRRAATLEGFDYSDALKARGAEGLVWDEAALDAFVTDPQVYIPGVAMGFFGLDEAQDRADLIAYLRQAGTVTP